MATLSNEWKEASLTWAEVVEAMRSPPWRLPGTWAARLSLEIALLAFLPSIFHGWCDLHIIGRHGWPAAENETLMATLVVAALSLVVLIVSAFLRKDMKRWLTVALVVPAVLGLAYGFFCNTFIKYC